MTTEHSPLDLTPIAALNDARTPGQWVTGDALPFRGNANVIYWETPDDGWQPVAECDQPGAPMEDDFLNALFCAGASVYIPRLLAEVRALRGRLGLCPDHGEPYRQDGGGGVRVCPVCGSVVVIPDCWPLLVLRHAEIRHADSAPEPTEPTEAEVSAAAEALYRTANAPLHPCTAPPFAQCPPHERVFWSSLARAALFAAQRARP